MTIPNKPNKRSALVAVFCFIVLSSFAQVASAQSLAGLRFSADDFSGSLEENTSTLSGNVTVEADDIELHADKVTVQRDENTEPTSIVATGNPVKIVMEIDDDDKLQRLEATSKELTYDRVQGWIKFVGESRLTTDNIEIKADNIHIDIESKNVTATMDDPEEQVEINMYDIDEN